MDILAQSEPLPAATTSTGKKKPGKESKQRAEERFRLKKNKQFSEELQATILRRLKISDPTTVNAIELQSSIVPTAIPISFAGVPRYTFELWERMKAIGTRPFAVLATPENYIIFNKVFMALCELKLCYAQFSCQTNPLRPLTTLASFTDMQRRLLEPLSRRLPYPLIIYLEAIGCFVADRQPVIPVLASTAIQGMDGVASFAPSQVSLIVRTLRDRVLEETAVNYTMARILDTIPGVVWQPVAPPVVELPPGALPPPMPPHYGLTPATVQGWGEWFPTPDEMLIFNKIVASMDTKPGFNIHGDIKPGLGSVVQAIRFPEEYNPTETETMYYTNTEVPAYEEKLAPALMLGIEFHSQRFSRFSGTYDECLKHGSACQAQARHAVIWSA